MSEWNELEIDNLPPDILTGNYEFEYKQIEEWIESNIIKGERYLILRKAQVYSWTYRYRKTEPIAPTHEEIIAPRFWLNNTGIWEAIISYKRYASDKQYQMGDSGYVSDKWFIGKESANYPPKEN